MNKTYEQRFDSLKNLAEIQCSSGNYDVNEYMRGLANGLLMAVSVFDDQTPPFIPAPARAQPEAKDAWRPIEDAPKGTKEGILVFNGEKVMHAQWSGSINSDKGDWLDFQEFYHRLTPAPTMWHPLPNPKHAWGVAEAWLDINTAPKNGIEVMVFQVLLHGDGTSQPWGHAIASWNRGVWSNEVASEGSIRCTHWQPLPVPPPTDTDKGGEGK